MRLFFALCPDPDTRSLLADAASALRLSGHARRVPPENYHLTLAFVGEVSESQQASLVEIGRAQRAAACSFKVDALDYWPEPKVIVTLASEPPQPLVGLSARLQQAVALRGRNPGRPIVRTDAPLRAHVTLARKVAQAPVLQAMSPIHWRARSFCLMCSDTSGSHSVYTVVDTWPLLDKTATA